jgi:hypothetical protein
MTTGRLVLIGLLFLVVSWAGAAGIAYGVVELAGGGPSGERGLPGVAGAQGPEGQRGLSGSDVAQTQVKRLASMWAVQTFAIQAGEFTSFDDPRVEACVDYVLNGTADFTVCPGFTRGGP